MRHATQDADAGGGQPTYVFAYGSLLSPDPLRRTLPAVALDDCVPARCPDHIRAFTVAFPNDGSQADKSYFTDGGARPEYVLFADLRPGPASANGVCLPVTTADLARLRDREKRYRLVDLTGAIQSYPGLRPAVARVLAFVGRAEFTDPQSAAAGYLPSRYLAEAVAGARFWECRAPGFLADFHASTVMPEQRQIVPMHRIDH